MNNPIPSPIIDFIQRHHVVSLACYSENDFWGASCFYAFDVQNQQLIILTDSTTRHGQLMQHNPQIFGTIAGQPEQISKIEGIQFHAHATRLFTHAQAEALKHYLTRHPIAIGWRADVWSLKLSEIKYTENRTTFGHKIIWKR